LPFAAEFVAFLSTAGVDAAERLFESVPYTRVDDYRVADDRADLLDGGLQTTIDVHADGGRLAGVPQTVWTGSLAGGGAAASLCADWTTTSGSGRVGLPSFAESSWISSFDGACSSGTARLYCFLNRTLLFWDHFESQSTARWSMSAAP